MNKFVLISLILNLFYSKGHAQTRSYFSNESLNCIVLLEKKIGSTYIPHGTGFLVYNYNDSIGYNVITCGHILKNREIYICVPADTSFVNKMNKLKQDSINFNGQVWFLSGNNLRTKYRLIKNRTFVSNDTLDIGIFSLRFYKLAFESDTQLVKVSKMKGIPKSQIKFKKDIPLGIDVYFTGFPLYIGTEHGYYKTGRYSDNIPNPLVRKGSVAWKSETNNEFLLDAFSYGGNSGSPIFTINDFQNNSYFIGMVLGHLPSETSENIGIAKCIWSDKIVELIEKYDKIKIQAFN